MAEVGAPPVQLPPGQQESRKAVSLGPLLSMPGFSANVKHCLQHNTLDIDGAEDS